MSSSTTTAEPSRIVGSPQLGAPVAIIADRVSKRHRDGRATITVLDGLSLEVRRGEMLCLVGASGCGKSTLLNLIAGLDQPTAGAISRPAGEAALMFQDGALFPWLTLQRNVDLALRLRGLPRAQRRREVSELLRLVHLDGFEHRRPHELSGGMRQRAALARALAQERPILLMDEPFGALDVITRDMLQDELERIWAKTGLTVVFVTHNVGEAVRLGDRVVVLSSRPARVVATYEVNLPRPRSQASSAALTASITERLRKEIVDDRRD